MTELTQSITTILLAIVGVAIIAVLVSKNANTTGVIQSAASGFGNSLAVAESPVTGSTTSINLSYPSDSMGLGNSGTSMPLGF